ncbi:unnamed protein product [Bursaphelenchus xylophilus]|uniref:(pine wood nematode) hypothetical protein n=1 Tax=Bursaphelenchus xylophilus TaxID=6326 RepID=A0A7I8WZ97_BURXY|nr:unnamed protein product [Bursaphelenchus xylophilus]CAG9102388.1 unnamed protein product [Bursaphelenchus xylophilus]
MTITFETPDENGDQAPRRASQQQKKRNSVAFKRTSVKFASPTPSESEEVGSISDDEPVGSRNIWLMRSLQGGAVLLMLTAVIGTCYYAISNSNDTTPQNRERFNSSKPYTPNFTQYCVDGIVNITKEKNGENTVETSSSFWYQNAKTKKLHVKLDRDTIALVFNNSAYFAKLDGHGEVIECNRELIGYDEFLEELSLVDMVDRHSEIRQFHNEQAVYVFEGSGHKFSYANRTPFLVQAYGNVYDGRLTGFQYHFNPSHNNGLLATTYRYYNMKMGTSKEDPYKTVPSLCFEK